MPRVKGSLQTFKNKYTEVELFITCFEKLCIKFNLLTDVERIKNVTQYYFRLVKEFMEGLPSFKAKSAMHTSAI